MFHKSPMNSGDTGAKAVNVADLLDRCLGDALFAEALLTRFEQTARANIDKAAQGLAASDAVKVAAAAHALKGAAGVVSADALRAMTEELERCGQGGDMASARACIPRLNAEMQRYLASLPAVLETLRSEPAA